MNKLVKEAWLNRLRSGKYKQGQGALFDGKSHCCLGVLCELYKDVKGGEWIQDGSSYELMGEGGVLPDKVMKWAGLKGANPYVTLYEGTPDETIASLSELNDADVTIKGKRLRFKGIAKIIEKHF